MSPEHRTTNTDRQSETGGRRPGRPSFPRELVLAAAERLFAGANAPKAVTMDDIAAAAGVGKGTLFRAFGSRDGLLDALFAAQAAPLRAELEREGSPVGPEVPPLERVLAVLDALVSFKFAHRHLTAARELAGSGLLTSPHYVWMHDTLRGMVEEIGPPAVESAASADYTAHVLLGALRVDLLDELLASGRSPADIRGDLAALARRVLTV
ncbi:putative transcriptional regulator [Actinacidiphila reveromycinica]|uniref:Putative transcriptional regulator n=1 Tax=Actinacidiphila reveromycinica TaxID=659352 RepID=A0A7U3USQ5_9ACTN|nr:TetR/AcrR family transcriptional regulator [Streptomyces sp. SN-593]BBA98077.1 putative transcriptional regulator [Streptomyces sp. SN-593]